MTVAGLVLAAGASLRLGEAKQLLPYAGRTLLDASLDVARGCGFDHLFVTLGGSAGQIRERVDLTGFRVVGAPGSGTGCGSSVSTAVNALPGDVDALVLLLGDQPGVRAATVRRLVGAGGPLRVCRYDDGPGHPFLFTREVFADLRALHGDRAVWRLLHSGTYPVTEVPADGPVPIDVDTRADYEKLLADRRG